jgi:hypothetical protein
MLELLAFVAIAAAVLTWGIRDISRFTIPTL